MKRGEWNPVRHEIETNWGKYGFQDQLEAHYYALVWPAKKFGETPPEQQANAGYRGIETPEQLFQRYPVDEFRASVREHLEYERKKRARPLWRKAWGAVKLALTGNP